jgi:predicted RNase H-like nuclease
MRVAGLDVFSGKWVGILLDDGSFAEACLFDRAEEALTAWSDIAVLAIDIPIGMPDLSTSYRREADSAARAFIKPAGSSVFSTPPREVLIAPNYQAALAVSRTLNRGGISAQSYALASKILEIDELAAREPRVYEVHPEVTFRAMSGGTVLARKKSWNGQMQRRRVLQSQGIELPEAAGAAGAAAPDDLLDAAAAAWSANRIANGVSETLPNPPVIVDGRPIAIHY